MAKEVKSIKWDADVIAGVHRMAKKEKRSFNNMTEMIATRAVNEFEKEQQESKPKKKS